MARKSEANNSILSFVALVLIIYAFGLPTIIAILNSYYGSLSAVIVNVVDLIPFGEAYNAIAIQIVNSLCDQTISYMEIKETITIAYILQETAKGLFTAIIFEALNLATYIVTGLVEPDGVWNKAKRVLITVMDALLAACLAPIPLNYIFAHLDSLNRIAANCISFLLSACLLGGGVLFFIFLRSFSIAKAIVFLLIKYISMPAAKLSVSYLSILVILLGWENGLYGIVAGGISGFLGIAILLGGIELMISSVLS